MTDEYDGIPELEPWAEGMRHSDALFVREYMVDLNQIQAMIRAGHSEENAKRNASRMIRRPAIARAIAAAMEERNSALRINANTVLGEAFRGYCAAVEAKNWGAASRFLEMCGKHVDVQAFRTMVGITNPLGGPLEDDLSVLDPEELEWYGRIARKLERSRAGLGPETE